MYIERVPNRNSPPAVLLRSSHWDHGKIRKVTHANLSKLPQPLVDAIALLLRGGTVVGPGSPAVRILDSRPCGHVAALLGGARQLGLGPVSEQQLYDTLDWLARRQPAIEAKLARRHLQDGCLALYDLTSVWYTGEHCELARRGYSRDGKRGSRQILVGLLCDAAGRPVSAEVCAGNTATVPAQVDKLRRRFGLSRVVLVGDRGMLTAARCCISLCFDKILQIIPMQGRGILWINSLLQERVTVTSLTETYGSTGLYPASILSCSSEPIRTTTGRVHGIIW